MNAKDLLLHETTKKLVEAYISAPKPGLLLSGDTGVGLGTLARAIASELVQHSTDVVLVEPDEKGTIPIERVRRLFVDTRDVHRSKQVVIVDDIDKMSYDAQNAFLKLLEEPTDSVFFILTSHNAEALLPTISSRVHAIEVRLVASVDAQSLLRKLHISDATKLQQMLFLASGLPEELTRLAKNEDYFSEQSKAIRLARDFLAGSPYDRLVVANNFTNRVDALQFIGLIARLLDFSNKKNIGSLEEKTVTALETAAERISSNGHVRTQLINLSFSV